MLYLNMLHHNTLLLNIAIIITKTIRKLFTFIVFRNKNFNNLIKSLKGKNMYPEENP